MDTIHEHDRWTPDNSRDRAYTQHRVVKTILRQRQTEPGLVTIYDIQPGNGAGLFLQPRNLHGVGRPRMSRLGTGHWTPGLTYDDNEKPANYIKVSFRPLTTCCEKVLLQDTNTVINCIMLTVRFRFSLCFILFFCRQSWLLRVECCILHRIVSCPFSA